MKISTLAILLCLTTLKGWAQVPQVNETSMVVRNPIDTFVLQRLQQAKLKPSTEGGRSTLIRRLYFDLLGLPS